MSTNGTHEDHVVSTVIVGGGQAGLATAQALLSRGQDCVVLERNDRLGDNWRHHYDSLRLYTPARYDGLPGLPFPGEPWAYPSKDDVADYLQSYAAHLGLPVRLGVRVLRLARETTEGGSTEGGFVVETDAGTYHCDNVVVATGTFGRRPHLPDFAADLRPAILQLHSSEYRRPSQLSPGPVLVVGASHSGCDIALELAATRPTTLVGRDCGQLGLRWDSPQLRAALPVLVFAWRHVLTRRTPMGRRVMPHVRHHGGPMLRVKREDLAARGVVRNVSRVEGVRDGLPLLSDGTVVEAANIVWATGFEQHFDWIDLPVVGEDGWPREYRGVVDDVPGLFFCGLSFQYAFSSMVLPGVGRDAGYVADRIAARTREHPKSTRPLVEA
ncbi:MAG TPA: NAD(P)/FAD-dependent oxidoreductase [Intrasporangium sp.]|nr:NAD(P)/FAD-dependent oxidoreductase [Intrasporangium sp.]